MKKALSIILAVFMIASFCVCAFATDSYKAFSYYSNALTDEEISELNSLGNALVENYGVAAVVSLYNNQELESLKDTADEDFAADGCGCANGIVLVEDSNYYLIKAYGICNDIFADTDEAYDAFYEGDDLYDHCYSFLGYVTDKVMTYDETFGIDAVGDENSTEITATDSDTLTDINTGMPAATGLITDAANILTDEEEATLAARLDEIKTATGKETAILTVNDPACVEGTIYNYASTYYNKNFGGDGAVLVLCMYDRDWKYIFMGSEDFKGAYSDDWITDTVVKYLSKGDYCEGFMTFADITEDVYTGTENERAYKHFNWLQGIVVALVIGFVIALIATSSLKAQLKSVHMQNDANIYTTPGSMHVTTSRDIYLYSKVNRTAKPKNNSSGGSRSSGGGSHSGGGKF